MIIRPLTIMAPRPTPPTPPGPTFDTVTIGNQIWMSKNLTIDDGQGGIYTQTVNYGQGNVVEYYYTWEAALRVASSISGWHLPTNEEWTTLVTNVGGVRNAGTKLKSTYGWDKDSNGTDDFGFAAFPAGNRNSSGYYYSLTRAAYFWTATEYSSSEARERYCYTSSSVYSGTHDKTYAMTIRLVKDAT